MAKQPTPAMTVRDIAGFLAVDEKTTYRPLRAKQIPAFRVGGSWRFSKVDLDKRTQQQSTQTENRTKNATETDS